jgi:circadian clock protein KaiB
VKRHAQTKSMKAPSLSLVPSSPGSRQHYIFQLYIAGASLNSMRAVERARHLCEKSLSDRYQLDIIDLCEFPALAKSENVIAIPTLIRKFPLPVIRMIGDMSDIRSLLQEEDRKDGQ